MSNICGILVVYKWRLQRNYQKKNENKLLNNFFMSPELCIILIYKQDN